MSDDKKITPSPKIILPSPNIALPPKPDNITVILNAVQQLLNRMSIVEIKTIKNSANVDIINKTIELLEKEIKFIEKKANLE